MSKYIRELIEYNGLDQYINEKCPMDTEGNFKQTNVDAECIVPSEKPDIEQIAKVYVTKKVVKSKIVKTPVGTSAEGQTLTGYKLLIMGEISLKIVYVADEDTQSMHTFHADIPFCNYIVLPKGFTALSAAKPEIYIEDIYVKQEDARTIFANVTLMLVADTF